ncbi:MAG: DNA mismatch repair protein [Thermoanaerobaculia bacterium]|nr:DNA mismatch repair protein [Thermoanaerobaculia bacterium]
MTDTRPARPAAVAWTPGARPEYRRSVIPVPDLLHPRPRLALDGKALAELLETSFLGGGGADNLEQALAAGSGPRSTWRPEFFRHDLFLDDLVEDCLQVWVGSERLPVNQIYLRGTLAHAPGDLDTVLFRQAILRELDSSPKLRRQAEALYRDLFVLLSLFKASHKRARLDITLFRLEILEQAQKAIRRMAAGFGDATSGLARLHETADRILETPEYKTLAALLDYDNHLARLTFRMRLGADGKIRNLELQELTENRRNPFYRPPWRRLRDRLSLLRRGFEFTNKEMVGRVVHQVFLQISDWLKPLFQVLSHLGFYLAATSFRRRAEEAGLAVSLPTFGNDEPLALEGLFNPLLFRQGTPVPCSLTVRHRDAVLVITGPNSGGKTRLLQAVGISQVLGQSGLYVPAAHARLPLVDGLFASATERASVDQREGRLGTELLRIRELFESLGSRSLVLMDELCSGTNPSEAEEIFLMVLRLLEKPRPVALITTHFLDFARRLELDPPVPGLEFLQVEMDPDGQHSTYQFVPGVADTSLATHTARRLGVTLEELSRLMERRAAHDGPERSTDGPLPLPARRG